MGDEQRVESSQSHRQRHRQVMSRIAFHRYILFLPKNIMWFAIADVVIQWIRRLLRRKLQRDLLNLARTPFRPFLFTAPFFHTRTIVSTLPLCQANLVWMSHVAARRLYSSMASLLYDWNSFEVLGTSYRLSWAIERMPGTGYAVEYSPIC